MEKYGSFSEFRTSMEKSVMLATLTQTLLSHAGLPTFEILSLNHNRELLLRSIQICTL